ncbi:hypothetical protein INT45_010825, partial [Circinella minor]
FSLFPGASRTYNSNDTIIDHDDPEAAAASYPLKIGMPLVLLRNLDSDAGLCNRTKVFVTRLLDWSIGVKKIDQGHEGTEHFLPRINMCTTKGEYPFILCRRQLPVRLAFAMTIHKAQGQTLEHVGIRLQEGVFAYGQLYVALSRATNPNNIYIAVGMTLFTTTTPSTDNIVYHEILLPPPPPATLAEQNIPTTNAPITTSTTTTISSTTISSTATSSTITSTTT